MTNDIERLANDLVTQWKHGPRDHRAYQSTITLSARDRGYVVFYTLTWSPRVERDELGLPEVVVEAIKWEPIDPWQRTREEFSTASSRSIVESASRLLFPAITLLREQGHGIVHQGPEHRFLGWHVSELVEFPAA